MSRPLGSKNAPKVAAVVSSAEATTQTGPASGIKTSYREGGSQIVVPESNSSFALFGTPAEAPVEEKIHVEQSVPEAIAEQPKEEVSVQPESVPADSDQNLQPATEEVVYLEDILKKMNIDPSKVKTKTKVDGVESDVPFSEVKKSYQLEQHLTKRGQKIGEERRQLEVMRNQMAQAQEPKEFTAEPASEVEILRRELEAIRSVIQPTIYQNARQQLANDLKEQGFPDFNEYIDKIDARVAAEPDENKWKFYNTFDGAKQLYFQMKLEEARNQPAQQPTIQKKETARPPVIKIDGGNRPSQPVVDDYDTKIDDLMTKWQSTKNTPEGRRYLNEILRLKGTLTLK